MGNSRDADKFVVRLPDGLRDRIAEQAAAQHTSMNTFVIQALEQALDGAYSVEISPELVEAHLDRMLELLQQARGVAK